MKTAIITTTINVPKLLEQYAVNVKNYKHDCFFVVVGDKKTPHQARSYCQKICKKYGSEIYYLGTEEQDKYMEKFPLLNSHIPYNCISRRNIGFLYAYEKLADMVITIDDDNFLIEGGDFIKEHCVGSCRKIEVLSSDTGWLNPCDYIKERYGRRFYHRGFPLELRFLKEKIKKETKDVKIIVNAGFWLGEPDIDAITRLYYSNLPIESIKSKCSKNFALDKGTWSPFNSQNTSIAREVVPAYFLSPTAMRYDDIWASYVVVRIANHLGHYITFGKPEVLQKRNPHNYWNDWDGEDLGMRLTIDFVNMLMGIKLTGASYKDCYSELVQKLKTKLEAFEGDRKVFLGNYLMGMDIWVKTFQNIL